MIDGETFAKDAPQRIDGAAGQRTIGQLLLFGAIEQVEEGNDGRLGACWPRARPPGFALLELEQLGPVFRAEPRLMPCQQARELRLKLCDPISHPVPGRYRSR